MEGWIKLHRKLLDNPIVCKDSDYFSVWIYLLLNATHEEYDVLFKNERVTLKAGQLITGRKIIAEKFNIDENKVQRILKNLEKQHQIEQQTSSRNRLISIINWDSYQSEQQQFEQQVNNKRTTSEQQVNTNKNIKNIKNDKNIKKESKKEKTFNEIIDNFTDNLELRIELKNHLVVRKLKKGSLTNRAIELELKTLSNLSANTDIQLAIVRQSIEKGWVGFFPVKNNSVQESTEKRVMEALYGR